MVIHRSIIPNRCSLQLRNIKPYLMFLNNNKKYRDPNQVLDERAFPKMLVYFTRSINALVFASWCTLRQWYHLILLHSSMLNVLMALTYGPSNTTADPRVPPNQTKVKEPALLITRNNINKGQYLLWIQTVFEDGRHLRETPSVYRVGLFMGSLSNGAHPCPPDAGLCPDVWQALWRSWRLADIETCLLISWKRRMRAPVCRETLSLKGSLYPFCDQHCWERASTFLVYLMQEFRHYCLLEHIFSGRENEIKQKQIMKSMFFRTVSVINNYYFWGGNELPTQTSKW